MCRPMCVVRAQRRGWESERNEGAEVRLMRQRLRKTLYTEIEEGVGELL